MNFDQTDQLCIDTIRTLSIDAIQKANSGHPGLPLGAAPMAYVLWKNHLKYNPEDPNWPDRDRFVLSAGHGSMLLYALLHLSGYPLSLDDIKNFRQWGSKTPGHPESFITQGVEATTGPLGQGTANAVGMAIAERALAHMYNRDALHLVDHFTYVLAGDGDLMEGISTEAASLAGHLKLGKLIMLYDSNDISLDGPTDLAFTEDVGKRYEAYGWQVIRVENGDTDLEAIHRALVLAKADQDRPSLIEVKTTIGYGSPNKAGTSGAHGAPLGEEEIQHTKKALGWEHGETFFVPSAAKARFAENSNAGKERHSAWQESWTAYQRAFPDLAKAWQQGLKGELPAGWDAGLPSFETGAKIATRAASGKVLNGLAKHIPWLMGGDADLSCSTKTALGEETSFDGRSGAGRNIHYGVREHAMGAVANGMAYHKGIISYTATFFCFADYMRPAMRLAALSGLPAIYVFTHDSVAVGEDGPTHQPVEHLASLRAMPNMLVVRPADPTETIEAWKLAVQQTKRPVTLVFSRQGVPVIDRDRMASAEGLTKGAYVLADAETPKAVIIATGAEVGLALEAHAKLAEEGIATRVVSMPCWELFQEQDEAYRAAVLMEDIPRVVVEAGSSFGWERWLGPNGKTITIDRFGASAPGGQVLNNLGFNVENVVRQVKEGVGEA